MKIFNRASLKLILPSLFIFSLTACSDNSTESSDNFTGNETQIISIDPNSQTIFTKTFVSKRTCVANADSTHLNMKTIDIVPTEEIMHYEFLGDTLVLFSYDSTTNTLDTSNGFLLTGGTPGTLQGTWDVLPCLYGDDRNECNEVRSALKERITFQDKITTDWILTPFDFTRTALSFRIIRYFLFNDKGFPIEAPLSKNQRFDLDLPDDISQMQNISLTKASFATPYQTAEYSYDDIFISPENVSFNLSVTTNGTTCTLNFEVTEPDENTCIESNKPYFLFDEIPANFNTQKTTILYAIAYQKNNFDEFQKCLDSVIIRGN